MGHVLTKPYLVLSHCLTIIKIDYHDRPHRRHRRATPQFYFCLDRNLFHFGDPGLEEVRGAVQGPTGIDAIWGCFVLYLDR